MKIFLTGFMGAGKTYFLNKLKEPEMDSSLIDLDEYIFENYRDQQGDEDLSSLISRIGMDKFRQLEFLSIKRLIGFSGDAIISLGGGALENPKSLNIIKDHIDTSLVYIEDSFSNCWERIQGDTGRPLVKKGEDFCEQLFEKRRVNYQYANLTLSNQDINSLTQRELRKILADKL